MTDAVLLDGLALSATLRDRIRDAVDGLQQYHRFVPGLAVVLVGEDPASRIYVGKKVEQCEAVGMQSFAHRLPADIREGDLLTLIDGLNRDERVDGILVQLPLPPHIRASRVLERVQAAKDVDGFSVTNAGRLFLGAGAMVPCTPLGCMKLIKSYRSDLEGLAAVVVGRSNIVGKPMAQLLLAENCTVTMAHSRTRDLAAECRRADIIIAAVGRPQMIGGDWIKPGAIVVDVGINRIQMPDGRKRLVGDVDFVAAKSIAGAITPVPGGVGPMTVACLLHNTLIAACRSREIVEPAL